MVLRFQGPGRAVGFLSARAIGVLMMTMACSIPPQLARGGQAPADSLGANRSFLDRIGVNPSYSSDVGVNRTSTSWRQNFGIRHESKRLKADNTWALMIQKDSARNDYRTRQGTTNASLSYSLPGWGDWATGTEVSVRRNFAGSTYDRTVSNQNHGDLFLSTGLIGNLLSRALGWKEGALTWSLKGAAGVSANTDVRQRWNLVDNAFEKIADDSTYATGSTRAFDSQISVIRGQQFKLDASGHLDGSGQDSRTAVLIIPDSVQTATNRNSQRQTVLNASWTPRPGHHVNVSGQYSQAENQYYQYYSPTSSGQESKKGLNQKLSIDMAAVPLWGVELGLTGSSGMTNISYRISPQNQSVRSNDMSSSMHFITGPAFGWLRDLESTTEFSWSQRRNIYAASSNYREVDRDLRQTLRRPVANKVVFLATAEGDLDQFFYRNHDSDRDELRWLLDGALGYKPIEKIESRVSGQWQQRRTVNVPAANSAGSNTQNSYRIGAEINYAIAPTLRVKQTYAITADYQFYDFSENSNGLIRTTEVRTLFDGTVGSRVKLSLDHSYRFKDSGQYQRSEGGPRLYGKATEENYQYLTLTTRYDFSSEFNIHGMQRMEVRRTTQVATQALTKTKKIEFTGGLSLNHRFSPDFSVQANVDQTRSTAEPNYLVVTANVTKRF